MFQILQEFGEFWSEALKSLKIWTLISFFCTKCKTFGLKKYRGVVFDDTEDSWKMWGKMDLWFGKWHDEFDKFSPEYSKVYLISTLMGYFWSKYNLNKLRRVMCNDTEEW